MSDLVLNVAKGSFAYYCGLPAANDALRFAVFSAQPADSAWRDYDTFTDVTGGATEQTTMGRKTLTTVVVTTDDTNDRKYVDCDDITYTAAGGSALVAAAVGYDDDTTGGTDTNIIPFFKYDVSVTPAGGDVNFQVNTGGLARAS